jgi:hypothetical protein
MIVVAVRCKRLVGNPALVAVEIRPSWPSVIQLLWLSISPVAYKALAHSSSFPSLSRDKKVVVWVDIQWRHRHRRWCRSCVLFKDCSGLQETPLSSWPSLRITSISCIPGHELVEIAAEVEAIDRMSVKISCNTACKPGP